MLGRIKTVGMTGREGTDFEVEIAPRDYDQAIAGVGRAVIVAKLVKPSAFVDQGLESVYRFLTVGDSEFVVQGLEPIGPDTVQVVVERQRP
jgi:hypothetical protein